MYVNRQGASAAAALCDERIAGGSQRTLEGLIVAVKDNISVQGMPLTCGSSILGSFSPVYTATSVSRLVEHGAIAIGKTNMDEFAMGSSNETSAFGPVLHPLDPGAVPGGSSGGSAAAVAANLCHVALGSDTGGSIRQPAALCGAVGTKPTYGRISRYGLVAFASSLDQIGPITRNVYDAALVTEVMSGADPLDSTTAQKPATGFAQACSSALSPSTIAIPCAADLQGCAPEVLAAFEQTKEILRSQGHTLEEISLPFKDMTIPVYYILATAEASSNLARFDGIRYGARKVGDDGDVYTATRSQGFGTEVKRRIMLGTYVLSSGYYDAYYQRAQKVRRKIADAYGEIFSRCRAVVLPTAPELAFARGAKTSDPVAMYLSDIFTVSANLTGSPAISIPAPSTSMPVGMQVVTNLFDEAAMFSLAASLERGFAG